MKKLFSLIELIIVIIVVGILAAIVLPNVSSFKEDATISAVKGNVRNLQTATDTYLLKKGILPSLGKVSPFQPRPLNTKELYPDYIYKLPQKNGFKYWVDFNSTIWGSTIDSPNNISYTGGQLSWDNVEGAEFYRIYKLSEGRTVTSKAYTLSFIEQIPNNNANKDTYPIDSSSYLISAVDKEGFETAPAGVGYEGYEYSLIEYGETNDQSEDKGEEAKDGNTTPTIVLPKPILTTVPEGWIPIYTIEDLEKMRNDNQFKKYILMNNLDFGIDPYSATEWKPIYQFYGTFNGNGLMINNLKITNPTTPHAAFISELRINAVIENLELRNVNITGTNKIGVGSIAGSGRGQIRKVKVSGTLTGSGNSAVVGGILGDMGNSAKVTESMASVIINGATEGSGGIAGRTFEGGGILNSYSEGKISGSRYLGGIVGHNRSTPIKYSYSIAENPNGGGIVGYNSNIYFNYEELNYWDVEVTKTNVTGSNPSSTKPSLGKTTVQMKQQITYQGFDFTDIWTIDEGNDYPKLKNIRY